MTLTNLLSHALPRIAYVINKTHHEVNADDNDANAHHVLAYMNTYVAFFKEHKDFLPQNEFDLLIETIKNPPKDKSLLEELIHQLITISDLLYERDPKEERLQTVSKIDANSQGLYLKYNFLQTSPTVDYINENSSTIYFYKKSTEEISIDEMEVIFCFERISVHSASSLETLIKTKKLTDSEISNFLRTLISGYEIQKISKEIFIKAIRYLHHMSIDKKEFVKIFLNTYKSNYNYSTREKNLLKNMGIFFSVLDEQLEAKQFSEALSETKFHLDKPFAKRSKSKNIYNYYEDIISLYKENYQTTDNLPWHKHFFDSFFDQGEEFLGFLKSLSKRVDYNIQLLPSDTLRKLPLGTQIFIAKQNNLVQKEFDNFVNSYIKVNEEANKHQQRNIILFFSNHYTAIYQIIHIMGADGVRYMQEHLGFTVLNLERMLLSISILPNELLDLLAEYFKSRCISVKNTEEIDAFYNCIVTLGLLINIKTGKSKNRIKSKTLFLEEFSAKIDNKKSPKEFLNLLAQILLNEVLQEMSVKFTEEQSIKIFEHMEPSRFVQLAAASQKMSHDNYRAIFLNLLKLDLTGGGIDDFLHNTEQDNEIGRDIARHNQAIQEELEANGISPQTALSYDKTLDFIVLPDECIDTSVENAQIVLWTYLSRLIQEARKSVSEPEITKNLKNSNRIKKIITNIEILEQSISKNNSTPSDMEILNALQKTSATPLIKQIAANIEALKKDKAPTSSVFNEFAQHVTDQVNLIPKDTKEKPKKNKINNKRSIHYFRVVQWSKKDSMTFFLGDEVGCCLATTNSQFPAMVQRRMDDAMLFHVAIDKMTGLPAALIWLYLAETTNKEIILVANFFEVDTKYAVDSLRLPLLQALLSFTHQYCKDNPKISAFYMNQLKYGWNRGDLDRYPINEITIADKLGGPFIPDTIDRFSDCQQTQITTKQKYYLASLDESQFHKFNVAILLTDSKFNIIEKDQLIQNAVLAVSKKENDLNNVILAVTSQHQLELAPFYTKPMQDDPQFKQDVEIVFKNAINGKRCDMDKQSIRLLCNSPYLSTVQNRSADWLTTKNDNTSIESVNNSFRF